MVEQQNSRPGNLRRLQDPQGRRGRRVILLLMLLWMLNGFDLAFTLMANDLGHLNELNPLARRMMDRPYALIVFKLGMVLTASLVLLTYRHHPLAEMGCWGMAAVYIVLSVVWLQYFLRLHAVAGAAD